MVVFTHVALLRGINVGGKNVLPMKELKAILEGLELFEIRTYIQSGNVVFKTARRGKETIAADIGAAIGKQCGFTPQVLVLSVEELRDAIAANPYPDAESEPKSLHLSFLESAPIDPDLAKLEELRSETESFELIGTVFYLHAPAGIARSRLAASAEKALGVPLTARNWRTVTAVLALTES